MPKFNAELLLVIESDSYEGADEMAESIVKTVVSGLWTLQSRVVEASVEAVAEKRESKPVTAGGIST